MTEAIQTSTATEVKPSLPSDRDTTNAWWKEEIPFPLEYDTKKLFIEYSKIPEDRLEQHLIQAREQAWDFCPYACIGLWLFLKLQLRKNKAFDEAVQRTRQGEKLLDFGCGIGQDLRSLAHAGAPTSMLYGTDIVPQYFDAGNVLFNDAGAGISFSQANALDENALREWHGQFPVVTCNYVQHVFSIEDQEKFATVILKLLSGGPNDLFFGRTGGTRFEARREIIHGGQRFYRHSETSFKEFWERMAAKFGRKANVETWIDETKLYELPEEAKVRGVEPVCNLIYHVRFE